MQEPSKMSVLSVLMQRDAEATTPDESRKAASWQAISRAIDQEVPLAARPATADPFLSGLAASVKGDGKASRQRHPGTRSSEAPRSGPDIVDDSLWNPRTAFNPKPLPSSSWQYPSRRFVYQALSLVLTVAIFLAAGLIFSRGGLIPGTKPTVTIPEDTIPLVDPTAGRPSLTDLQAFLTKADSETLAALPGLPPDRQRTDLQALCSRAGIPLTNLPAAGGQASAYWTARKEASGQARVLLILARENADKTGWTVVYQIVPANQALPTGADLDTYFADLLAD